jgi:SAM-dependent methyltransferase
MNLLVDQSSYLKNLDFMTSVDKYNEYVYGNIQQFLGEYILDVGCGVGNITRYFLHKKQVIGIDKTVEYLRIFKEQFKNVHTMLIDVTDNSFQSRLSGLQVDTVVATNILEHIKEDQQALLNFHSILPVSGKIVIVVPSYKWLFGTLDEYDLHCRRYSLNEISLLLKSSGFKILKHFRFNALGILLWLIDGKILRFRTHKKVEGSLINKIMPFVKFVDKLTLNKIGLSLVVIAEKTN